MDNTKVFCEDCRHCKPRKSIVSLFGLDRMIAYHFAKCVVSPILHKEREDTFVYRQIYNKREDFWYCGVENPSGNCKKFEQKVK